MHMVSLRTYRIPVSMMTLLIAMEYCADMGAGEVGDE